MEARWEWLWGCHVPHPHLTEIVAERTHFRRIVRAACNTSPCNKGCPSGYQFHRLTVSAWHIQCVPIVLHRQQNGGRAYRAHEELGRGDIVRAGDKGRIGAAVKTIHSLNAALQGGAAVWGPLSVCNRRFSCEYLCK